MGAFVISTKTDGAFKFAYAARRGKTIITSIGCREKPDCEKIMAAFQENIAQFTVTKIRQSSGKHYFRISKDGLVLANSRKFTTELLMQKGLNDFLNTVAAAEILDFSNQENVFGEIADNEAIGVLRLVK